MAGNVAVAVGPGGVGSDGKVGTEGVRRKRATAAALAAEYGVSRASIYRIWQGRGWTRQKAA